MHMVFGRPVAGPPKKVFGKPMPGSQSKIEVSSTGIKTKHSPNPGSRVVGHVEPHPFHRGLPITVHMAEPGHGPKKGKL